MPAQFKREISSMERMELLALSKQRLMQWLDNLENLPVFKALDDDSQKNIKNLFIQQLNLRDLVFFNVRNLNLNTKDPVVNLSYEKINEDINQIYNAFPDHNYLKLVKNAPSTDILKLITIKLKDEQFNTLINNTLETINAEENVLKQFLSSNTIATIEVLSLKDLPKSPQKDHNNKFIFSKNKLYFVSNNTYINIPLNSADKKTLVKKLKENNSVETQWLLSRLTAKTIPETVRRHVINLNQRPATIFKYLHQDFPDTIKNLNESINALRNSEFFKTALQREEQMESFSGNENEIPVDEQVKRFIYEARIALENEKLNECYDNFQKAKNLSITINEPIKKCECMHLLYQNFYTGLKHQKANINNIGTKLLSKINQNKLRSETFRSVSFEKAAAEFKNLYNLDVIQQNQDMETIKALDRFFRYFTHVKKTHSNGEYSSHKTNSTGIQKIISILQNVKFKELPANEKLAHINEQMQQIAQAALAKSELRVQFWRGRTDGAKMLYHYLKNHRIESLEDIIKLNKLLDGKTLVHNTDPFKFDFDTLMHIYRDENLTNKILGKTGIETQRSPSSSMKLS